jgi:hypothetical protein
MRAPCLFNCTGYAASNVRVICEKLTGKDMERGDIFMVLPKLNIAPFHLKFRQYYTC